MFKDPFIGFTYNAILIVINYYIKYIYFIPFTEKAIIEQLTNIILIEVISQYRIPKEFLTDRNKLFILKFWKSLINLIRVYYKILILYYP